MNHPYALVELVWDDACSDAGWQTTKQIKFEPQKVVTVGLLIAENKDYIIIAHTYSADDYVGWFQIPKGMILSRKTLKRAKKGQRANSST